MNKLLSSRVLINLMSSNVKMPGVNCFSTTSNKYSNIFNVQDEEDFKNKVLNNKKPVIVDFHAV